MRKIKLCASSTRVGNETSFGVVRFREILFVKWNEKGKKEELF